MITLVAPSLPYGFAKRHGVVVLDLGETALVGLREGADPMGLVEARRALGRPLAVEVLPQAAFDRRLSDVYAGDQLAGVDADLALPEGLDGLIDGIPAAADLLDGADDAPVIRLINGVIAEAVRDGASDIHLETYESALVVRMRLDGVLRETMRLSPRVAAVIVSRIKVMARLDIAERRLPQDGRIPLTLGGKSLDVRVSTLPSRHGERVVLRILDRDQAGLGLEELGMNAQAFDAFRAALAEPNGIVLVTGPTGSGKTTSLYAAITALNDATRNILTVEDPVEYAIDGVGQTQVNTKVGMTFAAGLRAILRQDPDVVMVGEIRDAETASVAVQAALTGHLVLSTVHTNDAVGAVTRLRDMGVEPFLLASTVRLVVAQRLVRRLCEHCRTAEPADAATARSIGLTEGQTIWRPHGCGHCSQTGYVGRKGLYEVVRVDDRVRRLIAESASEDEIAGIAFAHGGTLFDAARTAVAAGVTSAEEALRVARQETAQPDAVTGQGGGRLMPAFQYTAVDGAGRMVSGRTSARDVETARRDLTRRRLAVLDLNEGVASLAKDASPTRRARLSSRALALLTRQLAALVAVTPIEEALRNLAVQTERPAERRILDRVHAGVLEGRRLSDAMADQGQAFPPLYRAMVAAGEQSGALQPILTRLADGLEQQQAVRAKVITALVYPAVLAVVALGVIVALMAFVVPKVVDQFDSMNQTLPAITRVVIALSDLLRNWGWLLAIVAALIVLAGWAARRRPAIRLKLDRLVLRLPVIGRLTRDLHAAQMARTLATMLASGLPVLEGLNITARTVSNRHLRAATEAMAEAVREGAGLSAAMRRANVFPPILLTMTASGESAGRLEPMLEGAADYLEREFSTFTATLLSLLEPAIIVVMGGLVALIVLSILLPILQINTLALR